MTAQPYAQTMTAAWSVMDDEPRLRACFDRLNEQVSERYRDAGQWLVKATREATVQGLWSVETGKSAETGEPETMPVGDGMARAYGIDTDTTPPDAAYLRVVWWPR